MVAEPNRIARARCGCTLPGMSDSELALVTRLGACDAVLDDLDKRIAQQEARIPAGQDAVAAAQAAVHGAEASLKASKDAEKALAREVRLYEQRRDAATRALEHGHGDPDAAERQVSQCSDILDELETRQLEQMDVTERASEQLGRTRATLAEAEAVLATARQEAPPALESLRAERALAQSKRDAVWAPIPKEVQNRYGLVRAKRKTAVSLMIDGYCNACRRKVPLSEAADVRQDRLRSCANCGRYLTMPPE